MDDDDDDDDDVIGRSRHRSRHMVISDDDEDESEPVGNDLSTSADLEGLGLHSLTASASDVSNNFFVRFPK